MTEMIVPDSIQPYVGWKALRLEDGHLCSPSESTQWPQREALTAICGRNRDHDFEWKLVRAPDEWTERFYISASVLAEGTTRHFPWPEEPEPGFTWITIKAAHNLENCQCGIYVVETPEQCRSYLQMNGMNVLCKVAVWGKTVIANRGARGQYAYPQEMIAGEQQAGDAQKIAEAYGIPCSIVEAPTPLPLGEGGVSPWPNNGFVASGGLLMPAQPNHWKSLSSGFYDTAITAKEAQASFEAMSKLWKKKHQENDFVIPPGATQTWSIDPITKEGNYTIEWEE